ncbi:MAG TPA: RNA polymerase sigma factor [Polyangiaceae bacterium]|jgi:RNA polymerase sigma-70 factor (ECF subfamily)|nr:RNA polymerase sigma factor [Polyangiaceae bacterium]
MRLHARCPAEPKPTPKENAPDFRALFEAEFSYVSHTLRRLGVREADLEDVAHDVFITVHRLLPEYDPARPLRPWLFGIAFRVASDYRRLARHAREVPEGPRPEPVDGAPPADEQLVAEQARRLVLEALDELELDRRAVLVLHDIDGHTMPEIAQALGIPLNTAYSRLRLSREELKAAVRRARLRRGER